MKELKFDKEELQLIAFKLGNEEYTVPIEAVQEIIMPQTPTHLPKTPKFMEGVINLRGHIIPVIDARKRFEMIAEISADTRIIIIELEDHTIGLVVDAVSEVVHIKSDNIEPPPMEMGDNDFILGVGKLKDRLLILLDPSNFLNVHETESMQKSIQVAKNITKTIEKVEEEKAKK
jgi:purine-binding chemotaxis protein CheW